MTNNTPDYNDNLYFEEKKMDCKNCPYTDEYCASGDCERNADVSITLTEKWKKGELPVGEYYYTTIFSPTVHIQNFTRDVVSFQDFKETVAEILAPVPSYDEWKNAQKEIQKKAYELGNLGYKIKNQRHEIDNRLKEIEKLKELLKRVNEHFKWVDADDPFYVEDELWDDIKKVLEKKNEVLK